MKKGVLITGLAAAATGALLLLGFGQGSTQAVAARTATELAVGVDGQPVAGPYAPRDECASLPGYAAFRSALFSAVAARDPDALLALSHPGIELDFGGGAGLDEFRRRLAADDMLWEELAALQDMGCASDSRDEATMPWLFTRYEGNADPFAAMLSNGQDIPIRTQPDPGAAVMRTSSYEMLELAGHEGAQGGFYEVAMDDGGAGYVAEKSLRPLLGYRVYARRGPTGWMIESFLAGD